MRAYRSGFTGNIRTPITATAITATDTIIIAIIGGTIHTIGIIITLGRTYGRPQSCSNCILTVTWTGTVEALTAHSQQLPTVRQYGT